MIKYIKLGADKQLNEIVMTGSHDAGITSRVSRVIGVRVHFQCTASVISDFLLYEGSDGICHPNH